MATPAAVALVEIRTIGQETVQGVFRGVGTAVEKVGRQGGTALRTVAQATASVADAGRLSGGSMATILGQLGDLAFGFGPAGPLVGALAVTSGVLAKLFLDARHEITETRKKAEEEMRRLIFEADSARTESAAHETAFQIGEAQRAVREAQRELESLAHRTARGEAGIAALAETRRAATQKVADAQAKLNELVAKQITLGKLAADQFDRETAAAKAKEAAEKAAQAATPEARARAQDAEITQLTTLAKLHALTGADLTEAQRLEASLTAALDKGNVSRAERVRLESDLDKLRKSGALLGVGGPGVIGGSPTFGDVQALSDPLLAAQQKRLNGRIHATVTPVIDEARGAAALLRESLRTTFAEGVAGGLVDGIAAGFSTAFKTGSIGKGFKALGAALLSGIGGAMVAFGKAALMASTLMSTIVNALKSLNPVVGIAASLALIAAGTLLQSLGGAAQDSFGHMGALGGGVGGSAFTASAPRMDDVLRVRVGDTSAHVAAGMQPVQPIHVTVIGPNDPVAQRQITTLVRNAARRGLMVVPT